MLGLEHLSFSSSSDCGGALQQLTFHYAGCDLVELGWGNPEENKELLLLDEAGAIFVYGDKYIIQLFDL